LGDSCQHLAHFVVNCLIDLQERVNGKLLVANVQGVIGLAEMPEMVLCIVRFGKGCNAQARVVSPEEIAANGSPATNPFEEGFFKVFEKCCVPPSQSEEPEIIGWMFAISVDQILQEPLWKRAAALIMGMGAPPGHLDAANFGEEDMYIGEVENDHIRGGSESVERLMFCKIAIADWFDVVGSLLELQNAPEFRLVRLEPGEKSRPAGLVREKFVISELTP
jgi:hypothetical protein